MGIMTKPGKHSSSPHGAQAAATSSGNPLAAMNTMANQSQKAKKNVLGLDFEIPDELSQLLAQEMNKQQAMDNDEKYV